MTRHEYVNTSIGRVRRAAGVPAGVVHEVDKHALKRLEIDEYVGTIDAVERGLELHLLFQSVTLEHREDRGDQLLCIDALHLRFAGHVPETRVRKYVLDDALQPVGFGPECPS